MAKTFNMNMKAFFAMIMCGLSTFSLFPQTDYSKGMHEDAQSITNDSWHKTGQKLWNVIGEAGGKIEQKRNGNS